MFHLAIKALLTGILAVGISEIAKRSSLLAAILASLPLTSILSMIWLYSETQDLGSIEKLSIGIFWMVLPTLLFFLILPALLRAGIRFYPALLISCLAMASTYAVYSKALRYFGIVL